MARPIFVSCRRTDEANFSAVQSRLSRSFGEDNVSIGEYPTEQADAFADELQEAVTGAKVVLAIIGPRWEAEFGEQASSRPAFDPVLMALALAIKAGVHIIPILVKRPGTSLKEELLPTEIRDLARLPAFRVEGFNLASQDSPDIRRLMDEIGSQPGMSRARWGEKTIQYSGLDPNGRRNQDIESREIEKIGRRIYDWLCGEVQAHGTELSVAIWGIPGIGKSTLIHRLAHGDVAQAPVLRLYPDGVLFGRLGKSAGSKEITRNLQEWATADKLDVALPEKISLENTAGLESEMQHWHELLGSVLRNRKMLLVIDDVWDSEVARKLRVGGNDCAYIFTTRQKRIADDLASYVIEMPKLDESESLNIIKNIAPNAFRSPISEACQSDITQIVHRIDGLPLALVLLGSLVNVESKSANPGRRLKAVLKKFDRLNEIAFPIHTSLGETTLAAVIESSYAALKERSDDGEILRRAFRCLTALRPDPEKFSLNLALQVVATRDVCPIVSTVEGPFEYPAECATGGALEEIISELADYGLISAARDAVPTASSTVETEDGEGELYSIHRAVAECIAAYLTPQDKKLIYSSAANYFQQRLGSLEEQFQQSTSSYRKSFRYENPDWQRAMNNWRFYVMAQGDYANAAFKFTKEWFGAFWWWGCFESFEFCEALIRDWPDEEKESEKGVDKQDRLDLMNILACYPKETSERRAGKQSQWHTVRASLEHVREARELTPPDTAKLNGDQRELRGLTSVFLAETWRFGDNDFVTAEHFYRDACEMFEPNDTFPDESWNLPWMRYHLADCLCEAGRVDESSAVCSEAFSAAKKQGDIEVESLLFRLMADISIRRNDVDSAIEYFDLSVTCAYAFQAYLDLDKENDPDGYTIRFYPLMARRCAENILKINAVDHDVALRICCKLGEIWMKTGESAEHLEPALNSGDPETLWRSLFAPPLTPEGLADDDTKRAYAAQVRDYCGKVNFLSRVQSQIVPK